MTQHALAGPSVSRSSSIGRAIGLVASVCPRVGAPVRVRVRVRVSACPCVRVSASASVSTSGLVAASAYSCVCVCRVRIVCLHIHGCFSNVLLDTIFVNVLVAGLTMGIL